jgi:transcriptional regulator with XRE-family HTH domain
MASTTGSLLREARHRRGLTQRGLAHRAGVPQPTISAIEAGRRSPSVELFERIVQRGRLPLEIRLVDESPFSAVAHGRELVRRLSDPGRPLEQREEGAFRSVIDLRNDLHAASDDEFYSLVADRPPLSGTRRWDAFAAGVVEDACEHRGQKAPSWTEEPERFKDPPWFVSTDPYFRKLEEETTPASIAHHGVLIAAVELASL